MNKDFVRFSTVIQVVCAALGLVACNQVPISDAAQGSPFLVNATLDTIDANPGDGYCRDYMGRCSLRAAVIEANAWSGADSIEVPAGTYVLTIAGRGEDMAFTGDIDNTDTLAINGAGEANTIIDGGAIDRVLHNVTDARLDVGNLTVRNGQAARDGEVFASAGGGVRGEGKLVMRNVTLTGNDSKAPGGALAALGDVYLTDVTIRGNHAVSVGGGIVQVDGRLRLVDVRIDANRSDLIGGGLWQNDPGWASMTRVIITDNSAIGGGGVDIGGIATLTDCVVRGNAATGTGPAVSGLGGGIITRGRPLRLVNTSVEDNEAVRDGGGIFNAWVPIEGVPVTGTLMMEGGTISRNRAGESGGGLVNYGGTAMLLDVAVVGNRAGTSGGGVLNASPDIEGTVHAGRFKMTGGIVRDNYAGVNDGGVGSAAPGHMVMTGVTIAGNVNGGS